MSKASDLADLMRLALYAGGAWLGYKIYSRIRMTGEDVGGAIGKSIYELVNPTPAGAATQWAETIAVMNGTVVQVSENVGQLPSVRFWDYSQQKMVPVTGIGLPSNWRSAPRVIKGWPQLRAAGQPWYQPWDGTGVGLQAPFTKT